jgi:hypothetical protein
MVAERAQTLAGEFLRVELGRKVPFKSVELRRSPNFKSLSLGTGGQRNGCGKG